MSDYLLTIAIPTYNGAKTIRNMLDILLPQCTDEIELVISDNASIDETPEIIAEYQKRYPIRYIRNKTNIGPDANFLQCMKLASGKFTYLLSDDDILVEGAVEKILLFLKKHPHVALVYLDSVGFEVEYKGLESCHRYLEHVQIPQQDLCTNNRITFMNYAIRMWGFMSSYLWRTDKFRTIEKPEHFFGTYWLQSYIHFLCVTNPDDELGVISGPCLAAGEYPGVNNFATDVVDGDNYKKMLDFGIENAFFDKKQLYSFYVWRLSILGRQAILKERESGIHKTNVFRLFLQLWKYPYAWRKTIPCIVVPRWFIILRKKVLHKALMNDRVKRG